MEAYRWVNDLWSPAGWLPVHRDQLRAQCSVSSMGSLYLYLSLDLNIGSESRRLIEVGSKFQTIILQFCRLTSVMTVKGCVCMWVINATWAEVLRSKVNVRAFHSTWQVVILCIVYNIFAEILPWFTNEPCSVHKLSAWSHFMWHFLWPCHSFCAPNK